MTVVIGTSGWHYADWRGRFYPQKLAARAWLEHYSARFDTVEVNNAFYRLPSPGTFSQWAATVPADFVVAVKASRYLTHVKRLRDPEEPVGRLMGRVIELGHRLGPILLQLPPTMKANPSALDETLACFPAGVRVAVEVRHPTWVSDEVRAVMEARSAGWCWADGGVFEPPLWRTAPWGYVRFHRGTGRPAPCYTRPALDRWAGRIAEVFSPGDEVFCYFNNDPGGCAVRDARWFAAAAQRAGLLPTRVPGPRETPVG